MTISGSDCEKAAQENPISNGGYDRLAKLMGEVPDLAIFHRFADLSVKSLLHYQAELKQLQSKLARLEQEDKEAPEGSDRAKYDFNSRRLRESEDDYDDEWSNDPEQWKTMKRIREVLREYCKYLSHLHDIHDPP